VTKCGDFAANTVNSTCECLLMTVHGACALQGRRGRQQGRSGRQRSQETAQQHQPLPVEVEVARAWVLEGCSECRGVPVWAFQPS
jgi:hypothetical protein